MDPWHSYDSPAPRPRSPGEPNFIKQLVYFDKDNISDKVLKKISAYCSQPDFQPDIIGRVSVAAKSLCMWVRAMEVRPEPGKRWWVGVTSQGGRGAGAWKVLCRSLCR